MGGLDARYAVAKLGLDGQVLSVTTVGTPHRGSPVADWVASRFGRVMAPVLRGLGIPSDALDDLRTDRCARFNEDVADAPGVRYQSVAGVVRRPCPGREWASTARL